MLPADQLPEGTDHIIEGAGVSTDEDDTPAIVPSAFLAGGADDDEDDAATGDAQAQDKGGGGDDAGGANGGAFFGRFDDYKNQAADKARAFAVAGKDRATGALDDLVRMIEDAAGEVDERIGSQYGDYARRAAEGLGSFTDAFKDKDVDQIFDEARDLIKKSPGVAIGVAAALGFVVARVVRSGIPDKAPEAGAGKDADAA